MIGWAIFGCLCFWSFNKFCVTFQKYGDNIEKKCEFVCYFTGTLHAGIATCMAYYSMYYGCEGWEKGVTPLNDFNCMSNPRDIHYKIVLFTAGYLVYDFILYYYLVGASGTFATQTFIHHFLGASGFYITIYTGGVPTVYTAISLFVESSNFFANARWFTFAFNVKN